MIGENHSGVIVTHVDKASKFLVASFGKNKTSEQVNLVAISLFTQVSDVQRNTMTFDNGKESSGYAELSKTLKISYYFANPSHSWERGLNEHINGLLRQLFQRKQTLKL